MLPALPIRRAPWRGLALVLAALALALALAHPVHAQSNVVPDGWPKGKARLRFEVVLPAAQRAEPLTGRVYVMVSRTNEPEPRLQVGRVGAPMWGRDVERLAPGAPAVVDGTDLGTPVWDLADLPAGEYWVQAMVNVYS